MSANLAPGPLDGLRVLDLTAMLAGPYSTMMLTDLGADVVKIEPKSGDTTRAVGPFRDGGDSGGLGGYFQSVNRGKRSLVLDLKDPADHLKFLELARVADVVVENFSAGVMDRLGLSFETLIAENPKLVYATIRGFGDARTGKSPYEKWPALDVVAQAMGGFLSITGTADGAPIKSGPGIGDLFPAVLLALGIVSAVRHADRTGQGQFVDVSMYDAVLSMCERLVHQYSYTGEAPVPQGNSHPLLCPFDIMQTADGWLAVAAPHDAHWAILAEVMGHPEWIEDERYSTNSARSQRRIEVRGLIEPWFKSKTNAELVETFGGRIPVGPVNDASDIYADPHVAARGMLVEVEEPGSDERVTLAGPPIKFTRTPSRVYGRGPKLGEHVANDVLAEWSAARG
jgi:crotonobetainyl-CoA:carnitine CoA-transferase CaiB-like acyl-CoA transferase